MAWLSIKGVEKQYDGNPVLKNLSFSLDRGGQLGIAGATGSSKTTLLRIIAGLLQADGGSVWLDGKRVEGPDEKLIPGHSSIGFLSQHFELRNNYRVIDELEVASVLTREKEEKLYSLCQISHLLSRKTTSLSGGERQRIALARVLLKSPSLLLLDEPFSNLDPDHKRTMKQVLKKISHEFGITTILVSHDGADLLSWADSLLLMHEGQIIQEGSPQMLYQNPINEYVAGLLGNYTKIDKNDPPTLVGFFENNYNLQNFPLFIRPEHLVFDNATSRHLEVKVGNSYFMGNYFLVEVEVGEKVILVQTNQLFYRPGDTAFVRYL